MQPDYDVQAEQIENPPPFDSAPPQWQPSLYDCFDPKYGGPPSNYFAGDCGSGCNDGCGVSRSGCYGPIYVRGEYLLWWLKGGNAPPLVTTSPPTTARDAAGVLGQNGTSILFGGEPLNTSSRSGGRLVVGWWLDPTMRVEGEWFALGTARTAFDQSSDGSTILARPFFNLSTGAEASNVIAFPGQNQGSINISGSSSFNGAGLRATQNLFSENFCGDRQYRVDFLYGYRYLGLREHLNADSSSTSINPSGPVEVGTNFASADSFSTSNNFNGADLGVMAESRVARWCLTTIGRLGLGGTSEHATINGSSTVTLPNGTSTTSPGGLLAMPTNIGSYRRNAFALVPQLELKLAYDFTPSLRFTVGYDLMYWSRVVRPGDQIDSFVNTSQAAGMPLTGTPGPLFVFRESDLWVQGFSVGGEWRF